MFSFPDASRNLGLTLQLSKPSRFATGACIDSRTLIKDDLFIALPGKNQDGHTYLEEVFRKGAAGAVIAKSVFDSNPHRFLSHPELFHNLLLVSNPENAFRELAFWYRDRFQVKAVGITGSVGKTTTKEFLHFLLRQKYSVVANRGNFNNHLGLPLTLFRLGPGTDFCVAELGANHPGEISALTKLLKPEAGILTCVSPAHLEGFGSLEGVYRAKLELLAALPLGAPAILPDDDPLLFERALKLKVKPIRVGLDSSSDFRISDVRVENFHVRFRLNQKFEFSFPGLARFLARNAAMALAAAEALGLALKDMPPVWDTVALPAGRFQPVFLDDGVLVIDDSYNASPASFEKALETFHSLQTSGRKILVFADMLELGTEEKRYHAELGRKIATYGFDLALAYGPRTQVSVDAAHAAKGLIHHFLNAEEAAVWLAQNLRSGDTLLLKASRGMKVEKVLEFLREKKFTVAR